MRVVVIGAGEVGVNVARRMSLDGHDVTVVEADPGVAAAAERELDALVVVGNGASPPVLREVAAERADLFAAVSQIDEVNVIAALAARQLGARQTVARVRDPDFFGPDESFAHDVLGIDFVIDPDRATARDIVAAVLLPGAVSVEYFGDGLLGLAEVIVGEGSPLIGRPLAERERPEPAYIVGIERSGEAELTTLDFVPEAGDHLLVVASREHLRQAVARFSGRAERARECVLFGGGKIGYQLARLLEETPVQVTVLERNADQARKLAERLSRTTVLHEEGVSRDAQLNVGVGSCGAFVACAGDDRANLLAALTAKQLGAELSVSVVSREEFVPLVDALAIDAAYSPRLITAEAILRFVHSRSVRGLHELRTGFEAIELEAGEGAKIVGQAVGETHGLLHGCRLGAILRNGEVIVPGRGTRIEAGDRVLMLGVRGARVDVEPAFTGK
jgi:trk system potassium uptake protein TrkA